MTPEFWKQAKGVFEEAAELAPTERARFLNDACGDDEALRAEVDSLLAVLEDAGEFMEAPVVPAPSPDLRIGTRIGPYQIIQVVGEGGMGTVYQAVRVDDLYRKLVAIKVIKTGMHAESVVKRFETERQILAHFDHPNITKLLDGGTTAEGQPYFVMDFISGRPIDEYCDAKSLTITERLNLFLTVCSAVHYAHQNLVIHRDLKPQNILMAEDGTARLLDFGIAKLLDPDQEHQGDTVGSILMMTPQYASPEQLKGMTVTTATDVYSLGVILYQLLTGRAPYQLTSRSAAEMYEKICNSNPRRPSTVVKGTDGGLPPGVSSTDTITPDRVSRLRGTKPDRLARQLSGDLDNILLMALQKEPQRRYASVEQMAGDIRNHLNKVPVIARPDTFRYRTTMFVKRNTAAVIAGGMFALALVVGMAATTWEAHVARVERERSEQRFNEVRQLANTVLFELHDAIEPLPGSTKVRELLVKTAQRYLDHLATSNSDETLQRERALAYQRIGDVRGLPTKANLGDSKGALENYRSALELERALVSAHPYDRNALTDLARTLNRICNVEQSIGKFQDALQHCGETVTIQEALVKISPDDTKREAELASVYQTMAGVYFSTGDWGPSEKFRARSLEIFEKLHARFPDDEGYKSDLANAHLRMANVQEQTRNLQEGRRNAEKAVTLFKELAASHPSQVRRRLSITYAMQRLGSILLELGDMPGAYDAFRASLPLREQLLSMDPMDASAQTNLSNNLASVGTVLLRMDRAAEALPLLERQRTLAEKLVISDPQRIEHSFSLSEALENIGLVSFSFATKERNKQQRQKHLINARAYLAQAMEIYDSLKARNAITAQYASVPARIAKELQACDALQRSTPGM